MNAINSREYCTCPVLCRLSGWPALSDSRMKTRSIIVPEETRQTGMTHCYWHGQRRNISQPYQNIKHQIHFPLKFFIFTRGTHSFLLCRINRYLDSFGHLSLTKCLNVVAQTQNIKPSAILQFLLDKWLSKWFLVDVRSWCTLPFKVWGR